MMVYSVIHASARLEAVLRLSPRRPGPPPHSRLRVGAVVNEPETVTGPRARDRAHNSEPEAAAAAGPPAALAALRD